ncbi:MAG: hypothetical protein O6952_10860, partial [Planctomycetota bacterium]|nr:hypothetical protein [Planctomycetota bacterium]
MRRTKAIRDLMVASLALVIFIGLGGVGTLPRASSEETVQVIKAAQVFPISGPPIENGMVVIRGTKIEAVGVGLP